MNTTKIKHTAVPTNIITGFLGVGKTSAILHLLKHKPKNEKWAVLVNEFGEIGIDGSILEGVYSKDKDIFIKEVTGGCMCCTAGLSMQISLSLLLAQAKIDRLLIEPTGLGHPKEVLDVLGSTHYKTMLSLQKIITLVDARMFKDSSYTDNPIFKEQMDMADIVIGNKSDLYSKKDQQNLHTFLDKHKPSTTLKVLSHAKIHPELLNGKSLNTHNIHHNIHHNIQAENTLAPEKSIPDCGYLKVENNNKAYKTVGWRFVSTFVFDHELLIALLQTIKAERMKAVFITYKGVFSYNLSENILTQTELNDCKESKIEIISKHSQQDIESKLLTCIKA